METTQRGETFTQEETYAATRRPVELAETLLPERTSDGVLRLERERVFAGSWVAVGCAAQVREPGDVLVAEVGGRSVFVVRKQDGELRAFYNVCRHRGTRLLTTDDRRVKRFIRCPYHSWAYDLDGRLHRHAPVRPARTSRRTSRPVRHERRARRSTAPTTGCCGVAVETWGPLVFVNLEAGRRRRCRSSWATCRRGPPATAWRSGRSRAAARVRDRGQLEARGRELHGVLPPAVGPSRAGQGLADGRPPPLAGAGMYSGFCTSPIAQDTERRRLAERPCADRAASTRPTRSARASSGCSPTSPSTSSPTTCSSSMRGP